MTRLISVLVLRTAIGSKARTALLATAPSNCVESKRTEVQHSFAIRAKHPETLSKSWRWQW
eukprot:6460841-Amphidinium_carterae.2